MPAPLDVSIKLSAQRSTSLPERQGADRAWLVLLAVGLAVAAIYPLTPVGLLANLLYFALGAAGVVGIVIGTHRHQPRPALPWRLMALGLSLWVAGDTLYALQEGVMHLDPSILSLGDACYLMAYPLFAVAMVTLARDRLLHRDPASALDALLVASGLGLLVYELVVRPAIGGDSSLFQYVVTVGYPVGDVLLLTGLVRLTVAPGAWTASARLLLGAVLLLVVADVTNSVAEIYVDLSPRLLQVLWLASYVLWGAAALHPSMRRSEDTTHAVPMRVGPLRLVALGAAVLVAPAVLAAQQAFGLRRDVWAVVVGSVVLFVLVVARMYLVLRQVARAETERAQLQDQLAHDASHDFLTGLANRPQGIRLVETALHRARRSGDTVALLFIDLDGFKRVNDTFGHAAGDEVLVQVAQRLTELVRGGDVVARLGGDEFILLLEPVDDASAALQAAQRVVADMARPFELSGVDPVRIGASVGVAVNSGLGTSAEAMLHHADLAAYRAKSSGKGRADLYDLALREAVAELSALEAAIRQSIDSEELRTFYQPIVGLQSGDVIGYEALVRWERPGVGIVPPAEFVDVAEQSDLICDLDTWVLNRACADFAVWGRNVFDTHVYVSVNVSARHLADTRVTKDVADALAVSGLSADRLIIEVTETSMADELRSVEHLRQLRSLGIKIAIDDFGTGYSSLSRLQEMPADIVKIDRSFLDEGRRGWLDVLRLIVGASHAVGLRTVAEGIEDAEQLAMLARLGCDAGQGYHLARPLPAGAVPGFHRVSLNH